MRDFLPTDPDQVLRVELRDFPGCGLLPLAAGEAGCLRLMFPDLYRCPLERPDQQEASTR